jgi:ABC-2 type transport system permease protein
VIATRAITPAGDLRAFIAACRKELRVARRYPTQIIGTVFWSIALPGVWVLMGRAFSGDDPRAAQAFAERAGTAQVAGFVFAGYAMYMWLSWLLWMPGTALRNEQVQGSLEAVFLTPTTRLVPLFAPPISHLPRTFGTLAFMALAMRVLFGVEVSAQALVLALAVVLIAMPATYAIGALFAIAVLRLGETGPLVQLVRGLFSLASGITFPIAMLPAWAQLAAWTLPPTYIVSDIRAVLFRGLGLPDIALDLVFLVVSAGAIALAAAWLFRVIERSARRTGMLGRY